MKWKLKLIAESDSGERREEDVVTIEREDLISPATAGLTIAEGKTILEGLQKRIIGRSLDHRSLSAALFADLKRADPAPDAKPEPLVACGRNLYPRRGSLDIFVSGHRLGGKHD